MGSADTPEQYEATEDKELSCFMSLEDKREVTKPFSQVRNSFTSRPLSGSSPNTSGMVHRPAIPSSAPKPLTDEEYCGQQLNSGRFFGPMMEVVNHPILVDKFWEKLKNVDRRLYDVSYAGGEVSDRCSTAIEIYCSRALTV